MRTIIHGATPTPIRTAMRAAWHTIIRAVMRTTTRQATTLCAPIGPHVSHAWIQRWLGDAPLTEGVRHHARAIFALLAHAEGAVHGVVAGDVEFHEVGAWDSIVDIVAAAFLIDAIGPATWTHGALPLGGGGVATAHGVLPVPGARGAASARGCGGRRRRARRARDADRCRDPRHLAASASVQPSRATR